MYPKSFMKSFLQANNFPKLGVPVAIAVLLLGWCLFSQGCRHESQSTPSVLMKVGERSVTADEYRRSLNIYRTSTGLYVDDDLAAEREMQIRFVQQLADQLVLLEHARTLGIEVSDQELDEALETFKRDYPDDVFEQLLLENAITLEEWKASLRTRLIIERVIQKELEDQIRISEQDMAAFMAQIQNAPQDLEAEPEAQEGQTPSDTAIVNQLRRSKTETAYADWMAALKKRYPVEIDQTVLQAVLAETAEAGSTPRAGHTRPDDG